MRGGKHGFRKKQRQIFFACHLDRANQLERTALFRFFAHVAFAAGRSPGRFDRRKACSSGKSSRHVAMPRAHTATNKPKLSPQSPLSSRVSRAARLARRGADPGSITTAWRCEHGVATCLLSTSARGYGSRVALRLPGTTPKLVRERRTKGRLLTTPPARHARERAAASREADAWRANRAAIARARWQYPTARGAI